MAGGSLRRHPRGLTAVLKDLIDVCRQKNHLDTIGAVEVVLDNGDTFLARGIDEIDSDFVRFDIQDVGDAEEDTIARIVNIRRILQFRLYRDATAFGRKELLGFELGTRGNRPPEESPSS